MGVCAALSDGIAAIPCLHDGLCYNVIKSRSMPSNWFKLFDAINISIFDQICWHTWNKFIWSITGSQLTTVPDAWILCNDVKNVNIYIHFNFTNTASPKFSWKWYRLIEFICTTSMSKTFRSLKLWNFKLANISSLA